MLVRRFPKLSETFILNQITGLVDAGHEVDIYAGGADERVAHEAVQEYRLLDRTRYPEIPAHHVERLIAAAPLVARTRLWRRPTVLLGALNARAYGKSALSLSLLYTAAMFVDRKPYDVIHCQFGTLAETAVALVDIGATSGAIVVSLRGSDVTMPDVTSGYAELFRRCALAMPVCAAFAERVEEMGCDAAKIHVHRSGIELEAFPFSERRLVGHEPFHVVSVARLEEKKGIRYGIEAIARVKATGRMVRYTIVGDGSLRSDLQGRIDAHGLQDDVHLVGHRPQHEVIDLLRKAHVLIAPSVTAANGDQEGIPNVLKEAMAMGMPVVSTLHSGIPELVENGVSGYLVAERDVEALADRLVELVDHSHRWPAMGRAGRARVERDYDVDRLNAELVDLYRTATEQP